MAAYLWAGDESNIKIRKVLKEAIMPKPLNEFGGWLRFFLALWRIHLISASLQLVNVSFFLVGGISADPIRFLEIPLLVSIQWSIPIIFAFWVIRTVRIKAADTPNRIVKLLCRYFVAFFSVWILLPRIAYFAELTPPDTTYYVNLLQDLIIATVILGVYSSIWFLYFRKSKRVLTYYGRNAGGVHAHRLLMSKLVGSDN
jgi:hypothetical protein